MIKWQGTPSRNTATTRRKPRLFAPIDPPQQRAMWRNGTPGNRPSPPFVAVLRLKSLPWNTMRRLPLPSRASMVTWREGCDSRRRSLIARSGRRPRAAMMARSGSLPRRYYPRSRLSRLASTVMRAALAAAGAPENLGDPRAMLKPGGTIPTGSRWSPSGKLGRRSVGGDRLRKPRSGPEP
jgi:hypothetical protein